MMPGDFVHLHTHSDRSALDGAGRVSDYAQRAAELGQAALALTEHGNVFSSFELYKECTQRGLKPIFGIEAYIAPSDATDRSPTFWGSQEQRQSDISGAGKYGHITLIAQTAEGFRNLCRLQSFSYADGFYSKPRIDLRRLAEYADGIIGTTGCPGGLVPTRLRLGQEEEALKWAGLCVDALGKDNVFVEAMWHGMDLDRELLPGLVNVARQLGLPIVATNDAHYVNESDSFTHDVLLCSQTKSTLDSPKRFKFDGSGYWLKSRAEMEQLPLEPTWLDNTISIAERIESYEDIFRQDLSRMPASGYPDDIGELEQRVLGWLHSRPADDGRYLNRLHTELGVIRELGFAGYFLVLADIVTWAKSAGILYFIRGSGNASLVAYALGVSSVDPIEHGLLFERFLNVARPGFPDIDLDIDSNRRGEVIEYAKLRYGQDYVAQIITHGVTGAATALQDAGRAMGVSSIGYGLKERLPSAAFGRAPSLSMGSWGGIDPEQRRVLEVAQGLEGIIRQNGVHAAGVVISGKPINDACPTWVARDGAENAVSGTWVTGWEHQYLEELGLIKFDFLGLRNLGVISETMSMVQVRRDSAVPDTSASGRGEGREELRRLLPQREESLPETFDDPMVYSLIASGNTLGVFQCDSSGMRGALRKVKPQRLGEVAAVLALYRPGPMQHIDEFARRSPKRIHHDIDLDSVLGSTFGVIVFQEQLMEIFQRTAGYSFGEAAVLLKIFKYKDKGKLDAERVRFFERGMGKGYTKDALQRLWEVILPFADYAFNKAHATGYAVLAYWTAWLKLYHPVEYMAALLGSVASKPDQLSSYLSEVQRLGIPLLPPDVSQSGLGFTPVGRGIRYGLGAIRGVGEKVASAVASRQPYSDLSDFFTRADKRCINVGVLTALTRAGALDSLTGREAVFPVLEEYAERAVLARSLAKKGEMGMFKPTYAPIAAPRDKDWRRQQEQAVLGVPLTQLDVSVSPRRPLDQWEWEYLRRAVDSAPGSQELIIDLGLTQLRGLATLTLTHEVRRAIEALGGVDVEEH